MKHNKNILKQSFSHPFSTKGFGTTETVVAAGAGILLIAASTLALRSTQNLISKSKSTSTLRQNTTNGLRLLRSEVERSLHILVNNSEAVMSEMEHTEMGNSQYEAALEDCRLKAEDSSQVFKPVFGIKMADLNEPVIYGLGLSSNNLIFKAKANNYATKINSQQGKASGYDTTKINSQQGKASGYDTTKINYEGGKASGYALLRCGAPLSLDGRYSETYDVFISKAIEDIGVMSCTKPQGDCEPLTNNEGNVKSLREIIDDLDVTFTDDTTPVTTYMQPSLRIMTDQQRKLIKFIDPNPDSANEKESYLESLNAANKRITRYPLYLAAFARADKRPANYGENSVINGAYFRNVSSQKVRFLVDGSGSMSACILWGSTSGQMRKYWNGKSYESTKQNCALTRMESLQSELTSLLTALPKSTKVGIQSFSSPGYSNHKTWRESRDGLVKIGNDGMRESAIAFVNSLDNSPPRKWGGTDPWEGLEASFKDNETDTLYFLSDGEPNRDRMGGSWRANDHDPTVNHYSNLNNKREQALKTNTIALGLESPWMEKLSTKMKGDHLQIDKDYVTANSSE
ncbi:hypothetical protein PMIT1318_00717 [Prochlorococcus marinus str. MIT 1318]|uniref:hypothetical protein n=1 Tax=Prochlorococcus TaxID=1218 RepID=UPI0007BC7535|nr:hypothetical protein [Prochlorococcus marinus]KZR72755.1 hypothetical protein PMIT1318_00717 [Prochlorococcus marinus str. MIT 1318]